MYPIKSDRDCGLVIDDLNTYYKCIDTNAYY